MSIFERFKKPDEDSQEGREATAYERARDELRRTLQKRTNRSEIVKPESENTTNTTPKNKPEE